MINVDIFHRNLQRSINSIHRARREISRRGFRLNFHRGKRPVSGGDVTIISTLLLKDLDAFEEVRSLGDVVIFENIDPATCRCHDLVRLDNVRRVYKRSVLRPRRLNNEPWPRYHLRTLFPGRKRRMLEKRSREPLTEPELAKIRPAVSLGSVGNMKPFVGRKPAPLARRRFDVAYAGNTRFRTEEVTRHRNMLCNALEKLPFQTRVYRNRALDREDYIRLIEDSKIFVSPYGEGEFCRKQFEAMYCGAIPLLPDQSFVESIYRLEPGTHYIECRPDWSDLEEKTRTALEELERHEETQAVNHELVNRWWQPETIADWFESEFKDPVRVR